MDESLRLATKDKDEKLKQLKRVMKDCLRKSQVDAKDDPKKLNLIGWRARSEPTPVAPPNQPTNLTPVTEGAGTVTLSWDKPSNSATGGYVRNYLIQRRDKDSGEFGPWSLLDTVYHEIAELSDQPQQTQMEYRVKASNAAGESLPSNGLHQQAYCSGNCYIFLFYSCVNFGKCRTKLEVLNG